MFISFFATAANQLAVTEVSPAVVKSQSSPRGPIQSNRKHFGMLNVVRCLMYSQLATAVPDSALQHASHVATFDVFLAVLPQEKSQFSPKYTPDCNY